MENKTELYGSYYWLPVEAVNAVKPFIGENRLTTDIFLREYKLGYETIGKILKGRPVLSPSLEKFQKAMEDLGFNFELLSGTAK